MIQGLQYTFGTPRRSVVAVRIRMKKMGRAHRPFFRICAVDKRAPRDGRVLEELGTYDPSVPDTDARAILKRERVDYWLGVGAQPSEKVAVLIKKYGSGGTHVAAQQTALEKLSAPRIVPAAGPAVVPPSPPAAPAAPVEEASASSEEGAASEAGSGEEVAATSSEGEGESPAS
jgi:small subunit ribosomal protein S16